MPRFRYQVCRHPLPPSEQKVLRRPVHSSSSFLLCFSFFPPCTYPPQTEPTLGPPCCIHIGPPLIWLQKAPPLLEQSTNNPQQTSQGGGPLQEFAPERSHPSHAVDPMTTQSLPDSAVSLTARHCGVYSLSSVGWAGSRPPLLSL